MKKDANPLFEGAAGKYFEAWRSQFEGKQGLMHALLTSAERMQKLQLAAAHEIQARHAEIAGQITKVASMQDLLELQRKLANQYYLDAVGYWTKVAALAQETQAEIAGMVQEQGSGALKQILADAPAPVAAGTPDSLASFMQSAFDAAREANENFVKTLTGTYMPTAAAKKPAKAATTGQAKV